MGRLLTKKGHTVAFAEDGEEFLKAMQAKGGAVTASAAMVPSSSGGLSPTGSAALDGFAHFDVILIDRHMPKLEGPEAIRLTGLISNVMAYHPFYHSIMCAAERLPAPR